MQTFRRTCFYNDYHDRDSNRDNWRSSRRNDYNRDNYRSNFDDKPDLQKQLSDFIKAQHSTNSFVKDTFMDLKTKLKTTTKIIKPQSKISKLNLTDLLISNLLDLLDLFLVTLNQTQKVSHPNLINQDRNEDVNSIFRQSGKSYDPPTNTNDQQNDSETPDNFDSDDEDEEPTP
ncbi:hypothetical protein Tco_0853203 [Tanacetum coccineum]